jgi:CTP:molybdopterin cytidylyltransferase MocA
MSAHDHVIVLAAGRGVRAGGPKALHRVGTESWWVVQQKRLARVGLPVTWVVSERVRDGMAAGGGMPESVVIADEHAPMFASVLVGMESVDRRSRERRSGETAAAIRGVFILPVDVPAPSKDVFTRLAAALGAPGSAAAAIPTHYGRHGHPVYVSWPFVSTRILGVAQTPDARLDRLIGRARVEVPVEDAGVCVNLNTAEEFEAWARGEWTGHAW